MGIESVLYRLEPSECSVEDLVEWLRSREMVNGDREGTYVVSGADHWIDVLVRASAARVGLVQFRVAVTNPVSVVPLLDELISELLARFGGRVTAPGGLVLHDKGRFDVLMNDFSSGRDRFTQIYGELILPVSADQVFSRLRAESGK